MAGAGSGWSHGTTLEAEPISAEDGLGHLRGPQCEVVVSVIDPGAADERDAVSGAREPDLTR